MLTTLDEGQKKNSGMQEMGEVREPMARDCWNDAQRLAEKYAEKFKHNFWLVFAAKPHRSRRYAAVMGWEFIVRKPKAAIVGTLVFKWNHAEKKLEVETDLCLPYDVPLSEAELSRSSKDVFAQVGAAANKSGSIWLA